MNKQVQTVIEKLTKEGKTISIMESCTGGGVSNAITNVEGASEVFSFAAITYSNEYKIRMGVPKEVIENFTVYSTQTADAMAKAICDYTKSDYGIGITGMLNRIDKNNPTDNNNIVYFTIYDRNNNIYNSHSISLDSMTRQECKEGIIIQIIYALLHIL